MPMQIDAPPDALAPQSTPASNFATFTRAAKPRTIEKKDPPRLRFPTTRCPHCRFFHAGRPGQACETCVAQAASPALSIEEYQGAWGPPGRIHHFAKKGPTMPMNLPVHVVQKDVLAVTFFPDPTTPATFVVATPASTSDAIPADPGSPQTPRPVGRPRSAARPRRSRAVRRANGAPATSRSLAMPIATDGYASLLGGDPPRPFLTQALAEIEALTQEIAGLRANILGQETRVSICQQQLGALEAYRGTIATPTSTDGQTDGQKEMRTPMTGESHHEPLRLVSQRMALIYQYLSGPVGWRASREIAEAVGGSVSSIVRHMKELQRSQLVRARIRVRTTLEYCVNPMIPDYARAFASELLWDNGAINLSTAALAAPQS